MKKSLKLLFCATALVSLARANINVGESVFTAEWEAGDALGILPVKTGGTAPATAAKFDYNTASAAFEGSLNDFVAGGGNYYAFFPHAQVTGTTASRRSSISPSPRRPTR